MIDEAALRRQDTLLHPTLDERGRRLFAATQVIARATGIARSTIGRGLKEIADGAPPSGKTARRPGGGRKRLADKDATLERDLLAMLAPMTLGCPERPLLWVSKSLLKLATALHVQGHKVSANTVRRLLRRLGPGQGHPLWRLRHRRERRLGQCRRDP